MVSQDRRHLFVAPWPDPIHNTVADVMSVILTDDTHLVPGEYESLQVGPALYQRAHFLNLVAAQVQPLQVGQAQDALGDLKQFK